MTGIISIDVSLELCGENRGIERDGVRERGRNGKKETRERPTDSESE